MDRKTQTWQGNKDLRLRVEGIIVAVIISVLSYSGARDDNNLNFDMLDASIETVQCDVR